MAFGQNGKSAFFLQVKMYSQNLIFVLQIVLHSVLNAVLESARFLNEDESDIHFLIILNQGSDMYPKIKFY